MLCSRIDVGQGNRKEGAIVNRKVLWPVLLLVLGLVLAACGGGGGPSKSEPLKVEVSAEPGVVAAGETVDFTAKVTGHGAGAAEIAWQAKDANGSDAGAFSPLKGKEVTWTAPTEPGKYTITGTATRGDATAFDTVEINVKAKSGDGNGDGGGGTPGDSLTIAVNAEIRTIDAGNPVDLTAVVGGDEADGATVEWSAVDAANNPAGTFSKTTGESVTWTAPSDAGGDFTITAQATVEGTTASDSVTIAVRHEALAIEVDAAPTTVEAGGDVSLSATVTGTQAAEADILWTVVDANGAAAGTLSDDTRKSVTWTAPSLAGGDFTITAKATAGGVTATAAVTITVDYEPLGVTLNASPGSTTIGGEPITLTATVTGTHAGDARIEWDNPEGRLSADEGPEVTFNPPNDIGTQTVKTYIIDVLVATGTETATETIEIDVYLCDAGSKGSTNDPCVISNIFQLQAMKDHLTGHFALGGRIDAAETEHWNGGGGFEPIGSNSSQFSGTLDGGGNEIQELRINRPGENDVGLFGYVGAGGEIRAIRLVRGSIEGRGYVGALAGINYGSIIDSHNSATISGHASYVGGVVGSNYGSVDKSFNSGAVSGRSSVGGVVGTNQGGPSSGHPTSKRSRAKTLSAASLAAVTDRLNSLTIPGKCTAAPMG